VATMADARSADAQLLKKLKEKAAEKVANEATDRAAEKLGVAGRAGDLSTLGAPLTADTLELIMKGLRAGQAQYDLREATNRQWGAAQERLSQLRDKNQASKDAWEKKNRATEQCQDDFKHALNKKREADMQSNMMANMAKASSAAQAYGMAVAKAQQAGDTAAVTKAQLDFYKAMGYDLKADSAAMKAKCGVESPKPAWMLEAEKIENEIDSLGTKVRQIEEGVQAAAVAASGMPAQRYHLARERLYTWFTKTGQGKQDIGWPSEEEKLFKPKAEELKKLVWALQ